MAISSNTALFSLIGTTYGGDGRTSFALPDLRSRVPIHSGDGPGLTPRDWGERGGEEWVTLMTSQIPAHSHKPIASTSPGTLDSPTNAVVSDEGNIIELYNTSPNTVMRETTNTGGGQRHANEQPFLVCNYIIALLGIFPSRS